MHIDQNMPWYRWYIAMLKDGTYRFILPDDLGTSEKFLKKVGGVIFTHAGYLIFGSSSRWYYWIDEQRTKEYGDDASNHPHIDVPNIECQFSEKALQWLKDNEPGLKEIGGKYYEFIPKH